MITECWFWEGMCLVLGVQNLGFRIQTSRQTHRQTNKHTAVVQSQDRDGETVDRYVNPLTSLHSGSAYTELLLRPWTCCPVSQPCLVVLLFGHFSTSQASVSFIPSISKLSKWPCHSLLLCVSLPLTALLQSRDCLFPFCFPCLF